MNKKLNDDRLAAAFQKYCQFCLSPLRSKATQAERTCIKCLLDPVRQQRYLTKQSALPDEIRSIIQGNSEQD